MHLCLFVCISALYVCMYVHPIDAVDALYALYYVCLFVYQCHVSHNNSASCISYRVLQDQVLAVQ